tara:strand:+ start:1340 stop:2290 length:951 start_codon:yes stop_codon:yes gene_type:complete
MKTDDFTLRMRAEPVPWFGLLFSWLHMLLGIHRPDLKKAIMEFVPGDIPSVSAIANGEAEIGMTTPPVCATMAYWGIGPYAEKMQNLRAILSFPHDDRLVWAVPEEFGITSIRELKDQKLTFSIGDADSPVGFAVDKILAAYGISIEEQVASGMWTGFKEDYLFKVVSHGIEGRADMIIHEGRKTPPWVQLSQGRKMTFLPIDSDVQDMMVMEYGFRKAVLSKGMIDGAVSVDTPTLDWSEWLLFTRADVPEDLVYLITKLVVEHKDLFELGFKGQPVEKSDLVCPMKPEEMWRNVGDIPLHPGAQRYFMENGYMS